MVITDSVTNQSQGEQPVYLKVLEGLEARRKTLSSPTKLAAEAKLAEEYNVARGTLRRAMEVLADRGAVTRRRGRGTFLMPLQTRGTKAKGAAIGFILPWWASSVHDHHIATTFDGVFAWADERDCHLRVLQVPRFGDDEHKLLEKVMSNRLDGLVWVHPVPEQMALLTAVARHLPCVVVGREYADRALHTVSPDYRDAAQQIDEHLVVRGHTRYSIVGKSPIDPYGAAWLDGVGSAFAARGADFDFHYYVDHSCFNGEQMPDFLLDYHLPHMPESTALVLTSSSYLMYLLASERFRAALENGLSVVAFDYGALSMDAYWAGKSVTHVRCDWKQIGSSALDMISNLLEYNDAPRSVYQPVSLVEGDTVFDRNEANDQR